MLIEEFALTSGYHEYYFSRDWTLQWIGGEIVLQNGY